MYVRLAALVVIPLALSACSKKKEKKPDPEPQIIMEEKPEFGSVDEQRARMEAVAQGESNADAAADKPWGEQAAELAKKLSVAAVNCNEKYLKALKPDELLVGKPALVTSDGVVTVMDDTCAMLADEYDRALALLGGKGPEADELLRHWSLLADMYSRVSLTAVNIGASAKRRKLNHQELKAMLPEMTATVVPATVKAAAALLTWGKDTQPGYERLSGGDEPAKVLEYWKSTVEKTYEGLKELDPAWTKYGYELVKGELFQRKRHLAWLESYWKARLDRERKALGRVSAGGEDFHAELREAGNRFYDAAEKFLKEGWGTAMEAFADRSTIDEPKLRAGKKALDKAARELDRTYQRLDWPKA